MEDILKGFPVIIEIPVAWGEMDAFKHVNNVAYFRYIESSRVAYFDRIKGWAFLGETGIGPILATTHCRYRIPLTYPDVVSVGARVSNIGDDRFTMKHIIVSHRLSKIAAEGDGVLVTYDYRKKKKVPMPADLRQSILDIERSGQLELT
ncbi:MAG: acyl-CoA thioesterase [Syntrophobacteraceae bacterium]